MNGGAGAWPATTMNGPLKASHRSRPPVELGWIGCPSIRAAREKVVSHKIVPSHYFSTPKFYSRWEGGDERIESPFHRRNRTHTSQCTWELFDYKPIYISTSMPSALECLRTDWAKLVRMQLESYVFERQKATKMFLLYLLQDIIHYKIDQ